MVVFFTLFLLCLDGLNNDDMEGKCKCNNVLVPPVSDMCPAPAFFYKVEGQRPNNCE